MSEVTLERIKAMAKEATVNLSDEEDTEESGLPEREQLRKMIREILKNEPITAEDPVKRVAQRVEQKISQMIWPEKALEVARRSRVLEVDQEAFRRYITKEITALLEEDRG